MISSTVLFWPSIVLAVIAMGTLAVTALLVTRRLEMAATRKGTEVATIPCAGPIARLSFEQSLDSELFAQAAEDDALDHARYGLGNVIGNAATLTLQGLQLWLSKSKMVVGASPEALKALRDGTAYIQQHIKSGRGLPHIVDRKTGKIIEVMKGVGQGEKLVAGAAAAAALVVVVAHMISSADLARSLKLVDQKLDLLLVYRKIDQEAKLERIYASAKELLAGPVDEARLMEIWRLRGELREIRAAWRREVEHHLKQIDDPKDASWLDRLLTLQSSNDQRIAGRISDGMAQLLMLEYSLRLDRVLAAAGDTWDESLATLVDELDALERLGCLMKDKANYISEKRRISAEPMVDGLSKIVDHYRAVLVARPDAPVIEGTVDKQPALSLEG